jgi:biopolymer transport protein ExbD
MKSGINVTPLVDVVLVLLIIFMVVTPMLTRGVRVELPAAAHHERRQDSDQIVVSVTVDGRWYLDGQPVDGEALVTGMRAALGRRRRGGALREVHLRADRRLAYGDVRKVIDRIHEAGAPAVGLGTEALPPEAGDR